MTFSVNSKVYSLKCQTVCFDLSARHRVFPTHYTLYYTLLVHLYVVVFSSLLMWLEMTKRSSKTFASDFCSVEKNKILFKYESYADGCRLTALAKCHNHSFSHFTWEASTLIAMHNDAFRFRIISVVMNFWRFLFTNNKNTPWTHLPVNQRTTGNSNPHSHLQCVDHEWMTKRYRYYRTQYDADCIEIDESWICRGDYIFFCLWEVHHQIAQTLWLNRSVRKRKKKKTKTDSDV